MTVIESLQALEARLVGVDRYLAVNPRTDMARQLLIERPMLLRDIFVQRHGITVEQLAEPEWQMLFLLSCPAGGVS